MRNDVIKQELVDINDLHPFQGNLKTLSKKELAKFKKQIKKLGFSEPFTVWENDGKKNIINGHQRLIALKSMQAEGEEIPKIPITFIRAKNVKEAKEKVLALTSSYGKMSRESLGDFLNDSDLNWDDAYEQFRFPEVSWPGAETDVAEDEVPDTAKSRVKMGEVWKLGKHTLICDDVSESKLFNGKADLLVTDPPYGVSYSEKNEFLNSLDEGNRNQKKITNDHLNLEEMHAFWVKSFKAIRYLLKDDASYYVTGPQGGDLLLFLLQALKETGFTLKHILIWAKNNHVLGRSDYNYKHEPIIYGWFKKHKFYGRSEVSVWEIGKPQSSKLHPTMKPVKLYARAIGNSSKEGDLVLDPFGGSGTCIIACEQLNRRALSFEIEPSYCDVIIERWETLTGERAVKHPDA